MIDDLVGRYVQVRDAGAALEKAHKERMAKVKDVMARLEAAILGEFQKQGIESARTPNGTAYRQLQTHANVKDWDATLAYIKATGNWAMLEKRVSKLAVVATMDEIGSPPPGVDVYQEIKINVRRT